MQIRTLWEKKGYQSFPLLTHQSKLKLNSQRTGNNVTNFDEKFRIELKKSKKRLKKKESELTVLNVYVPDELLPQTVVVVVVTYGKLINSNCHQKNVTGVFQQ